MTLNGCRHRVERISLQNIIIHGIYKALNLYIVYSKVLYRLINMQLNVAE